MLRVEDADRRSRVTGVARSNSGDLGRASSGPTLRPAEPDRERGGGAVWRHGSYIGTLPLDLLTGTSRVPGHGRITLTPTLVGRRRSFQT